MSKQEAFMAKIQKVREIFDRILPVQKEVKEEVDPYNYIPGLRMATIGTAPSTQTGYSKSLGGQVYQTNTGQIYQFTTGYGTSIQGGNGSVLIQNANLIKNATA